MPTELFYIAILLPALIVGIFGYIMARSNREQSIQIGTLIERLTTSEHVELTFQNEIRSREITIAERDNKIEDQNMDLLDKKDAIRSYRAVINRHEGRITVYETNENALRDELIELRNRILVEQAKTRFIERENNELRNELIAMREKALAPALDS